MRRTLADDLVQLTSGEDVAADALEAIVLHFVAWGVPLQVIYHDLPVALVAIQSVAVDFLQCDDSWQWTAAFRPELHAGQIQAN